jgi:murein DD-endopeptidase MepM/ murein hydrolase activator NlpD
MQPHSGRDFAPGANAIIPSIADGTMRLLQWSDVLGWVAVYDAKGSDGKTYFIGYSHLSCATHGINCKGPKALGNHSPLTNTKVGDRKKLGEPVGRVGNTGSASTGAHLHLTISMTLKGVFGATSQKLDPKVIIARNATAPKPATKPAAKPAAVKAAEVQPATVVYACPHCKKELK